MVAHITYMSEKSLSKSLVEIKNLNPLSKILKEILKLKITCNIKALPL